MQTGMFLLSGLSRDQCHAVLPSDALISCAAHRVFTSAVFGTFFIPCPAWAGGGGGGGGGDEH